MTSIITSTILLHSLLRGIQSEPTSLSASINHVQNQDLNTDFVWEAPPLCSPFGSYPNKLNITEEERQNFYPVVVYPPNCTIVVHDNTNAQGLATEDDILLAKKRNIWWKRLLRKFNPSSRRKAKWSIGRYDEDRRTMYTSAVFDESIIVDSYSGRRTIHLGVDLGAPVSTKVHAFSKGVVHSAGYNEGHGDYGNVVVIEHQLSSGTKIYALYGHLDRTSIKGKKSGTKIKKGQVIGRLGDLHENGGWVEPHCHFQLSTRPPETHDMPGAASVDDRKRALINYPDPRLVLGNIY